MTGRPCLDSYGRLAKFLLNGICYATSAMRPILDSFGLIWWPASQVRAQARSLGSGRLSLLLFAVNIYISKPIHTFLLATIMHQYEHCLSRLSYWSLSKSSPPQVHSFHAHHCFLQSIYISRPIHTFLLTTIMHQYELCPSRLSYWSPSKSSPP